MTEQACPDCGGLLTLVQAPCPSNGVGCGVVHWKSVCIPCRSKRWEERDRPATIGELADLAAKVDQLIAAIGGGDD